MEQAIGSDAVAMWSDIGHFIFNAYLILGILFGAPMLYLWASKKRLENKQIAENEKNDRVKAAGEEIKKKEQKNRVGLFGSKGVFLGYCGYNNFLPFMASNGEPLYYTGDRHILTFGPIGSGKGVTSQIPALLDQTAPCSAFVIDVKGQLAAVTGPARAATGQEVVAINPFDVLSIPTATYNPLRFLNLHSLSFASDCRKIAEGLVEVKKGDHWELSALDLVSLLIQWTVCFEDEKNLITVRRLLNQSETDRRALFVRMTGHTERPDVAEGAARYAGTSKEVADCIQTAVVQLSFLRDAGIERVLQGGGREISFADLKRKLMTVYLIIPPDLLNTHSRFLRLLVMSALGELFKERTTPPNPVLFMLDEFAQLGHMALIENVASVGRDYKIRLWPILQNIPQLKTLYGDKWESFLSSAGAVQFFAPNDLETAGWLSRRSGVHMVERETTNTGTSTGTGTEPGQNKGTITIGKTISEVEEPIFKPSGLLGLDDTTQIIVLPNLSNTLRSSRRRYYLDERYKDTPALGRDPYHMSDDELKAFIASARQSSFAA